MAWRWLGLTALLVLPAARAPAADEGPEVCQIAVLRNGFTIQSARHEVEGKTARLWLCASAGSGYVEVPSEQIAGFEPGPSPVPEERASAPGAGGSASQPAKGSIGPMIASAASRH